MKRRTVLRLGGLGLAALAGGGVTLPRWLAARDTRRIASACRAALGATLPDSVMAHAATEAFITRYTRLIEVNPNTYIPETAIQHFLTSTNLVVHLETGEELVFDEVFYPHRTPCANQLGANLAPAGEHDS